jgi:hypothetical protein
LLVTGVFFNEFPEGIPILGGIWQNENAVEFISPGVEVTL